MKQTWPIVPKRSQPAAEHAYSVIRNAICEGHLPPGRRIRETELADWLGVSRTPVREALGRLESEGLVRLEPRVGLVVASLDAAAIAELYDVRAALEGTAAALAARNASGTEIAMLASMLETERRLPADPRVLARHNTQFHEAIRNAAHNRFLFKSLGAIHDAIALLGRTTMAWPGRRAAALREHTRIIEAISARDPARADAAAREHVLAAYHIRLAMRDEELTGAAGVSGTPQSGGETALSRARARRSRRTPRKSGGA
ncbi:MAG TPA: GntR family transcriptional regulator [Thermodesulfobacteriota bacterium]